MSSMTSTSTTRLSSEDSRPEKHRDEAEYLPEYPSSWRLAVITLSLCLSIFCLSIDVTILATAVPRITDQFHDLKDIGWFGSSYLLTTCAFTLFFGKLYALFSVKAVFLASLVFFEVGSAISGAAPSALVLIIGRAIAGIGSAGVASGALLIVSLAVPMHKRAVYTSLVGATYGIASVVGPLLGGVFTTHTTWRWCFYINLPMGAVTFLFIAFFYQSPRKSKESQGRNWRETLSELDVEGTALLAPCVVCLLLAIQWGGSTYHWSNWRIILLFVLSAVLFALFCMAQHVKGEKATIPPRILQSRTVSSGFFFLFMLGGAFIIVSYLMPVWFQAIEGVSAQQSGIRILPQVIGFVLFTFISAGMVTATGYCPPMLILATALASIGAGLLTTLNPKSSHAAWIGYQALFGFGAGGGMQLPKIAVQAVLKSAEDIAVAATLMMFAQTLGGAIMLSASQSILNNQLVRNISNAAPGLLAGNGTSILQSGATALRQRVPAEELPRVLDAYSLSINQAMYVAVAVAALSIIGSVAMEWKDFNAEKKEKMAVEKSREVREQQPGEA